MYHKHSCKISKAALALASGLLAVLAGCKGSTGTTNALAAAIADNVPVVVDAGPPQVNAVNTVYTTVTLCAPGSASLCQTIDHVLVDTGSSGFRVLASVLGSGLAPSQLSQATDLSGNALVECTQFVDGYSWGPVKLASLQVGGETASNVPIQVIGDPDYPSSLIPAACINVPNGEENTVQQFGANGVLGIGNYLQDCGAFCAQAGSQDGSAYNACSSTAPVSCQPAVVAVGQQVTNPVSQFATDRNGVLIQFSALADTATTSTTGTLVFGIGTQANNTLGGASIYALDPATGTLLTTYAGTQLGQSYIDSGSNGYFFPDGTIPDCTDQTSFFCPASALSLTAQIQGANGSTATVPFTVSSADLLPAADAVAPDLAGPAGATTLQTFDWGLPFFYGHTVYVILEGASVGGVAGPAMAF
jgi:hypothetical protein